MLGSARGSAPRWRAASPRHLRSVTSITTADRAQRLAVLIEERRPFAFRWRTFHPVDYAVLGVRVSLFARRVRRGFPDAPASSGMDALADLCGAGRPPAGSKPGSRRSGRPLCTCSVRARIVRKLPAARRRSCLREVEHSCAAMLDLEAATARRCRSPSPRSRWAGPRRQSSARRCRECGSNDIGHPGAIRATRPRSSRSCRRGSPRRCAAGPRRPRGGSSPARADSARGRIVCPGSRP